VTPAHDWRDTRRLAPEVWLLCERELAGGDRVRYYLVDLPSTASLRALVRLAHQRWAIEQQYQELKRRDPARSFRAAQPACVATSCGPDRHRLQLSPERTPPTGAYASDAAACPRRHPRSLDNLKWMLKLKDIEMKT
jgi:hypothetical protein